MSDGLWFFVFKIDVDFFHQIVQAIGSISLVKFNFLVSLQLVQVLVYRVDNSKQHFNWHGILLFGVQSQLGRSQTVESWSEVKFAKIKFSLFGVLRVVGASVRGVSSWHSYSERRFSFWHFFKKRLVN